MQGVSIPKRVLIVEPDHIMRAQLESLVAPAARVYAFADFSEARAQLTQDPPDFLVTNLRLEAYNGLHLVYIAATGGLSTRTIVYSKHFDRVLALEAVEARAFFELPRRVAAALPAY